MEQSAFAEITETSLTSWTAGSWNWNELPDFGSFVTTQRGTHTLCGIVVASSIQSIDATRVTMLYKKTEEQLLQEQPQLMHYIRSSFTCAIIGFYEHQRWYYQLPPAPAQLHSFVQPATNEQIKTISLDKQYLSVLAKTVPPSIEHEELLVAIATQLAKMKLLNQNNAQQFIHHAWTHMQGNYQSVRQFAYRIEQLL